MSEWRPIETAPKSGPVFFALDDLGWPHIIDVIDGKFYDHDTSDDARTNLKWWMPIPPLTPTSE